MHMEIYEQAFDPGYRHKAPPDFTGRVMHRIQTEKISPRSAGMPAGRAVAAMALILICAAAGFGLGFRADLQHLRDRGAPTMEEFQMVHHLTASPDAHPFPIQVNTR